MTVLGSILVSIAVGVGWIVLAVAQLPSPSLLSQLVTVVPSVLIFLYLPRLLRAILGADGGTARRPPATEDDVDGT